MLGYFSLSSRSQVIASSCTARELSLKEPCIDSPSSSPLTITASLMPQIPQTTQMYLMLKQAGATTDKYPGDCNQVNITNLFTYSVLKGKSHRVRQRRELEK